MSIATINHTSDAEKFAQRIMEEFCLAKQLDAKVLPLVRNELMEKYSLCVSQLNSNFLSNILSPDKSQAATGLWEMVIVEYLLNCPFKDSFQGHQNSGPDWKVKLKDESEYYIEATCAGLPEKDDGKPSEIHRVIDELAGNKISSFDAALVHEAKSRISTVIDAKLQRDRELVIKSKCGYVLLVSYGNIPFYTTCDLYQAIQTVYPFGELALKFCPSSTSQAQIVDQSFAYQDKYPKITSPGKFISTDILGNEEYNWASAILFSKMEVIRLLKQFRIHVNYGEEPNDFVLIHNPSARYPLTQDLFNSRTSITIQDSQLVVEGKSDIFPKF